MNIDKQLKDIELDMGKYDNKKVEALKAKGWEVVKPEFDLGYFMSLGFEVVTKEIGFFLSTVSQACSHNPLGFISQEVDESRDNLIKKLTPNYQKPDAPNNWPSIFASYPSEKDNTESIVERAFEELTYQTIIRICRDVLPTPNNIFQHVEGTLMRFKDPSKYNFTDKEFFSTIYCIWEDSFLTLDIEKNWGSNNASITIEHNFYSSHLREYAQQALIGLGLEINPKTYQIGTLDPEFKLNSFPNYIKDYTYDLEVEMGFKKGVTLAKDFPDRFNVLITGAPGKGKTRWSQSYACEVLAPLGYLILVVDYSSMQDIVIPNYIDKVCIIVNDADTLALDRAISSRGETEQILSWLDGTRSSFIKPFFLKKRGSIITIMTANSVENWDEAALRKGRIHSFKAFDGETLANKT